MPGQSHVPIDQCAQCGLPAPWNSLDPLCYCNLCDWTWIRRASGWNRSHKKLWYCGACWPATDADLASALESICPKCKHAVYKSTGIGIAGQIHGPTQVMMKGSVERSVTEAEIERMKRASEKKIVEQGSRAMLSSMGVPRFPPPVQSRSASRSYSSYSRSTRSSESSRSSRSRSRSRRKKKKKKKKKEKRRKRKSSRSDSSSSSSRSRRGAASAARAAGSGDSEAVKRAKTLVLNKLVELQKMESKEQRMKEFRTLLRRWHPDKNTEDTELATEVFQFIQKGRSLLPN